MRTPGAECAPAKDGACDAQCLQPIAAGSSSAYVFLLQVLGRGPDGCAIARNNGVHAGVAALRPKPDSCSPLQLCVPLAFFVPTTSKCIAALVHTARMHSSRVDMVRTWPSDFRTASLCPLLQEHIANLTFLDASAIKWPEWQPRLVPDAEGWRQKDGCGALVRAC